MTSSSRLNWKVRTKFSPLRRYYSTSPMVSGVTGFGFGVGLREVDVEKLLESGDPWTLTFGSMG